jgi:hypothetical protein
MHHQHPAYYAAALLLLSLPYLTSIIEKRYLRVTCYMLSIAIAIAFEHSYLHHTATV